MKHKAPKPWGLIVAWTIGIAIILWVIAMLAFGNKIGMWDE